MKRGDIALRGRIWKIVFSSTSPKMGHALILLFNSKVTSRQTSWSPISGITFLVYFWLTRLTAPLNSYYFPNISIRAISHSGIKLLLKIKGGNIKDLRKLGNTWSGKHIQLRLIIVFPAEIMIERARNNCRFLKIATYARMFPDLNLSKLIDSFAESSCWKKSP